MHRRLSTCFAFVAVVGAAALAGCGGGAGGSRLTGRVADPAGLPVAGVAVSLEGSSGVATTTGSDGTFVLRDVPVGADFVVRYAKAGYAETLVPSRVEGGLSGATRATIVPTGTTKVVDVSAAAAVKDDRSDGLNAEVGLQAGSVRDAMGAAVAMPSVSVTTLVPSDAKFAESVPSNAEGIPEGKTEPQALLLSAIANVDLRDATGGRLKIDAAKPAALTFPIDPARDPGTATVPLWTLNEATGVWTQDGVASRDDTVTPAVYRATVSHFSWWSIGTYPAYVRIQVWVKDLSTEVGIPGALVEYRDSATIWYATKISQSSGIAVAYSPLPGTATYLVQASKAGYRDVGPTQPFYDALRNQVSVTYYLRPPTGGEGGP